MIGQLKKRFFRIALLALTLAMVLVTAVINITNWVNVRYELRETLETVAASEGSFPGNQQPGFGKSRHMRGMLNEARTFTVTLSENGGGTLISQAREHELSESEAAALGKAAMSSGKRSDFLNDYLFLCSDTPNGETRIVFLNCETRLNAVRRLLLFSCCACAVGIVLAGLFVAKASSRAIRPIEENMRRQKRFITDAGHELTTPLSVIAANMDVLDMDVPDNPWVQSTQKQVTLMGRLVEELVYLSRMEESETPLEFRSLSLKPLLEEVSEPFTMMAGSKGQSLNVSVPDGLRLDGDEASMTRLISVLCDNAVKYAPEGDTIILKAEAEGRFVRIGTENTMTEPLSDEDCRRLFDRFYRADPSRSKEKRGGFGIGLAIAAAIAEKHGGKAEAKLIESKRLRISFCIPQTHKD